MIQASVGFQCPNCTGASRQRVIQPAQRWSKGAELGQPVATIALIAVNVLVYLLEVARPAGFDAELVGRYGTIGVAEGQWWRMITGGFLHAGTLHLAFNMFALWSVGVTMEKVLGSVRFVAAYLACLLAGSFGALVVSPNAFTVGASGSVFGLFGLLLAFQLSRGIPLGQTRLGMVLAINLLFTFAVPGISIGGHLGGLIGGIAVGFGLFGLPKAHRSPPVAAGWAVLGAVVAVSVAGGFAAAAAAPAF